MSEFVRFSCVALKYGLRIFYIEGEIKMGQAKIIVSRASSMIGCLAKHKLELDGIIVGELKNGETLEIPIGVGNHTLKFIALGKCEKSININIAEETNTIHINIKYSKSSGKLEIHTDDIQNISGSNSEIASMQRKNTIPTGAAIAIVIVIVVAMISIISVISNTSNSGQNINEVSQDENLQTGEKIIYSGDNAKITYLGIDEPKTGLTLFTMSLKLENHFDKNAFITLSDSYINDTAVQFLGGNLTYEGVKPNKNAVCVFTFGYNNLGISKVEDINKVEFKIKLTNPDNFSEVLLETETITLLKE